jgi:hypothetical protein
LVCEYLAANQIWVVVVIHVRLRIEYAAFHVMIRYAQGCQQATDTESPSTSSITPRCSRMGRSIAGDTSRWSVVPRTVWSIVVVVGHVAVQH